MIVLAIAALCVGLPLATAAASPAPEASLLSDNFTQDSQLNSNLWEISGPVGLNFSAVNCPNCALETLAPSFSSVGMEIAQIDGNSEIGTIQSVGSFAPPFTATAEVEGTVSNGHTFVLGITSGNASSGVQITGNLDPRDCSSETNCGNPSTCGTPANATIAPNQCFYGIYARTANVGGNWAKTPPLNLSPSVNVVYTLEISVDSAGLAQFNVSEGGQLIGAWSGTVGDGPFYLIIAQSEGVPVPGPGPNQAYWLSASVSPSAPPPPPSSSSSSPFDWGWALLVVAIVLIILGLVAYTRRRGLTITVVDSGTASPVPAAGVWAQGPKYYSGNTGSNGQVGFGGVKSGDYSVKAQATGFAPSAPVVVPVKGATKYTVRLDRVPSPPASVAPAPSVLPAPVAPSPPVPAAPVRPTIQSATPEVVPAQGPPVPVQPEAGEESDGPGGARIRQIIQTFRAKGALSPDTALSADELGLSRIFVRIMKRRQGRTRVFVEVGGKYYLDEKALKETK